jgi:hypothetical protein
MTLEGLRVAESSGAGVERTSKFDPKGARAENELGSSFYFCAASAQLDSPPPNYLHSPAHHLRGVPQA